MPQSDFIRIIQERGYFNQCTNLDALDERLTKAIIPAYIGFDGTAPSLHVGSLIPIMLLRILQKCGHKPIVLMGGGTTKIGDPSGKDKARPLITQADINDNIQSIRKSFEHFLTFGDGPTDAIIVDNADWLDDLGYMSFLRDYGRHFSVNRMLSFDSVRQRLNREQPLSLLEFNYMVFQAYDFLELARRYDCALQMGGSDQWGNIVNGVELTRRCHDTQVFGLTSPLLTTASGAKMGKSEKGAVWLNEENLSHYDYWQFWRNTEDQDVGRFLRLFTELPLDEIEKLENLKGHEINEAKKRLADEATTLCRGKKEAIKAHKTAQVTFETGRLGAGLPTLNLTPQDLAQGLGLLSALQQLGFTKTNSEGRRHIQGGAVRLNDIIITQPTYHLTLEDMKQGNAKLSLGKKRHGVIKLQS